MVFEGTIELRNGHTVIVGNIPKPVTVKDLAEKTILGVHNDIEKFGFFETSTPNYATYYPDVSADDLIPNEEDFIFPVFRMLSEVIVSKGRPIDFSKPGVLKASMNMLVGQTINIDHETALGNAVGAVKEVYWQKAYTTESGIEIPAGINAVLKIDGKSNPRIVRGITMDPPSIHSNSVTVRFQWEPSHKFDDMNQFYNKLGTYDEKGELIRCIVTKVVSYHETSLVAHGADPYAQKVKDNGEIVNPNYSENVYQFTADKPLKAIFTTDYKNIGNEDNSEIAILSLNNTDNNINQNNNEPMLEELIQDLVKDFGFPADTNQESFAENLKAQLTQKATEVENLKSEKTKLEEDKQQLETDKEELEAINATLSENATEVENLTTATKDEALRMYKAAKGDDADQAIIDLIGNSDLKTAGALLKQYRKEADKSFTATCGDCGGSNISRKSGITSKEGLQGEGDTPPAGSKDKTRAELSASLKSKHKRKSNIFNQEDNK